MRRRPLAAVLALLSAALVLGGNALLDAADDRARGGSGVRCRACNAAEAPAAARGALDR